MSDREDTAETTTEFQLSAEQERCRDAVHAWFNDPNSKQVFRIDGFAGSGKTSTVTRTVGELDAVTLFAAFTGKAALVMQQRGCMGASTIHRLIYLPSGTGSKATVDSKQKQLDILLEELKANSNTDDYFSEFEDQDSNPEVIKLRAEIKQLTISAQSPVFKLNLESPVREADLVVIDESSMVSDDLAKDLLSFGVKVLVQGDPGQLPPVFGEGFFMRGKPDFTLTEIHRQAEGSPILELATMAREGKRLVAGVYGNCAVIRASEMTKELALEADIILCGRNKTRHITNARMRELRGFSGDIPMAGEKLVCLRNNHEKGLLNGSLWVVQRCSRFGKRKLSLTVVPEEGGAPISLVAHAAYFTQYGRAGTPEGDALVEVTRGKFSPHWVEQLMIDEKSLTFEIREAESFTYGSVLTTHKSQGSQWNSVLVLDESQQFGSDAPKHLYTAITRAITKVVVRL